MGRERAGAGGAHRPLDSIVLCLIPDDREHAVAMSEEGEVPAKYTPEDQEAAVDEWRPSVTVVQMPDGKTLGVRFRTNQTLVSEGSQQWFELDGEEATHGLWKALFMLQQAWEEQALSDDWRVIEEEMKSDGGFDAG